MPELEPLPFLSYSEEEKLPLTTTHIRVKSYVYMHMQLSKDAPRIFVSIYPDIESIIIHP